LKITKNIRILNKNIKNVLKFLLFLIIGIAIFFWVYKDQNISEIKNALKGADYKWIILSLFLGVFSHLARALRWNLLINPLGYKPRTVNTFFSVLIMYITNMALPRSGEIIRCGVVNKYEKVPFTKLLGTVFIERAADMVMLFSLFGIVLISQFDKIIEFLNNNPEIKENILKMTSSFNFLIFSIAVIGIFIFLFYYFKDKIKNTKIYIKIYELVKQFSEGIMTVVKMKNKMAFIGYSLAIWALYFLMTYVCFWSFDFMKDLSPMVGLTVFVMASFGMVAPSPGGIGTWHFMTIQTLLIYGVTDISEAGAFAFAVHGSTTLFIIILGALAFILLPVVNKNNTDLEVEKAEI
jgi:uncharacterized protein (TIRG00374 family)